MADDLVPDDFKNWVQTHCFNLQQLSSSSGPKKIQLQECSMVVIKDYRDQNPTSIFPPINHENLHISSNLDQDEKFPVSPSSSSLSSSYSSSASLSSSFSPSDTDTWSLPLPPPSNSRVKKFGDVTGWMGFSLEILRSKAYSIVSSYRCCAASANRGLFWSVAPSAAAMVVFWWLYIRVWRRRRKRQTESVNHLMTIIKEKDKKIVQLLHQIAKMNEVLVARHGVLNAKLAD
ncbi:putative Transmembrane protein [Quillaja saponaria]|uniref:Transmembrane protein n=1 Tax=Quillaja saponaria TaxID=32244 RepID=A0AAD7PI30_QUISA|nr:putative Transmembrane protein [Quillaja saponaria]